MLNRFVRGSRGGFRPDAIVQSAYREECEDDEPACQLAVVSHGYLFRVGCRGLGDWYDMRAVDALVNGVLEHQGLAERFVRIGIGAQDVYYLFGPPAGVVEFCEQTCIPHESGNVQRMWARLKASRG